MPAITLHDNDLDAFRTILRESLAGDHELIRDVQADREDETLLPEAISRVMLVEDLARQAGGLFGDGFAAAYSEGYPA